LIAWSAQPCSVRFEREFISLKASGATAATPRERMTARLTAPTIFGKALVKFPRAMHEKLRGRPKSLHAARRRSSAEPGKTLTQINVSDLDEGIVES
jgi:hypothetical protein